MPEFDSYEEMAEFWDTHSVADYWDQTEPAEFEISQDARRRYLIAVDRELLSRLQKLARVRGVSTESLANLLLAQSLEPSAVRS
jgi:CopG antitoxin of type II toxin-antitoxin system